MASIIPVLTNDDIRRVVDLAVRTWNESYSGLISEEQIRKMLDDLQSFVPIRRSIDEGDEYFLISFNGKDAGYIAFSPGSDRMFLSKIYILREFQRKGLASAALRYLIKICGRRGIGCIYLRVNRRNLNAIAFYRSMGFNVMKDDVKDIGNGFVMDDHIMALRV